MTLSWNWRKRKWIFIGPLPDAGERRAAARKASGIAEEFAGDRFGKTADGQGLICPQGQRLDWVRRNRKRGNVYVIYQAQGSICTQCDCHRAFRTKMGTASAKRAYQKRSEVAETPHAWIKGKLGIRKFRLRGLEKVRIELA